MVAKTRDMADERIGELTKLRLVALAAIRYVGAIKAPDPHEPFSIGNRRAELIDEVNALRGQTERTKRDSEVVRATPVQRITVVGPRTGPRTAPGGELTIESGGRVATVLVAAEGESLRSVAARSAEAINSLHTQPLPPKKEARMPSVDPRIRRELCFRDVEMKRRELHAAAAKYGAEANKRRRDASRVAELGQMLDNAARALTRAEQQLVEAHAAMKAAS